MSGDSTAPPQQNSSNHHHHHHQQHHHNDGAAATSAAADDAINANHHHHQHHHSDNGRTSADSDAAIGALMTAAKYTVFNAGPTIIRRDLQVLEIICNFAVEMLNSIRTMRSDRGIALEQLRMQESKLVRMVSELLVARAKLRELQPDVELPPAVQHALRQWLNVTGLCAQSADLVVARCANSLERLLQHDDGALRALLAGSPGANAEEERRIVDAAERLRRCRQMLLDGDASRKTAAFHWESWDPVAVDAAGELAAAQHDDGFRLAGSVPASPLAIVASASDGPANLYIPSPCAAAVNHQHQLQHHQQQPSVAEALQHDTNAAAAAAAALRSNSCPAVEPLLQAAAAAAAQFSPPSADAAAQTLAAVLNSQRRQTISPASHSNISNMIGRRSRTPSPSSQCAADGTPPPAAAPSFFARLAAAAASATSSSSSSSAPVPKFPSTPPPRRKMQTTLPVTLPSQALLANALNEQQQSLPKSESNESQLSLASDNSACSVDSMSDENQVMTASPVTESHQHHSEQAAGHTTTRHRLHTDSSPERYESAAHFAKPYGTGASTMSDYAAPYTPTHGPELYPQSLHVPRSPGTPLGFQRGGTGTVPAGCGGGGGGGGGYSPLQTSTSSESSASTHGHRFNKKFKVMSTCDVCGKQMFFGLKCKECKFRCHKDCEPCITSTCKLFCQVQLMSDSWNNRSPNLGQRSGGGGGGTVAGSGTGGGALLRTTGGRRDRFRSTDYQGGPIGGMLGTESGTSAGSSCNSSTPSSPALFQAAQHLPSSIISAATSGGGGGGGNAAGKPPGAAQQLQHGTGASGVGGGGGGAIVKTQFRFPDVTNIYKPKSTAGNMTLEAHLRREEQLQKQMRAQQKQQLKQQLQATAASSPRPHKTATATRNGNAEAVGVAAGQTSSNQNAMDVADDCDSITSPFADGAGAAGGMLIPTITSTVVSDDPTTTVNSTASSNTDSDRTAIRMDSVDDPDSTDDRADADGHWSRQNSVSMREWDIPFEDIIINEKIGNGRFGTVHGALWHGHVVVKILKEDYLDNEAFKVEVATFKKTRHENVVLFMGACMKPQAIVTARIKGNTLYTHMHVLKAKFSLNRILVVANQVSLGMGYLHARHITHKDLKTKNIFIESGRVIITDFGLFSATKLEYDERHGLRVPYGWLPYLAPEIIQRLPSKQPEHRDLLPFSIKSDIYAFGTVWYELLCQEFPYKSQAPEAIIYQVGRGMKQSLANLQAARDMKDLLMMCWAYDVNVRPDFSGVIGQLEKIPRKRLARSPSHPVQLSRSAESVF